MITNGITLIALVITIIVLLILAGVSIAMLTGENGILTQAQKAKEETEKAEAEEKEILDQLEDAITEGTGGGYLKTKGVNAPVIKDGMELVTYNEETGEWETNNSSSAYDYAAGEGTEDNNSSKWANAKVTIDGVGSYFVWIPRYAYKITYNEDRTGGIIDVKFLIGTTDQYYDDNGELQTAKRATTGHEDTTSDYYVHPAFTNNVDLGGWSKELTGIWVGKYEVSRLDATAETQGIDTKMKVQPGVSSFRSETIGNMYTYARNYSSNLNSHMLKNSEWGAVVYLTYSQYGRNGHEVTINNSSKYITGSAGNSVSAEADVGTTNDYTSKQGVLASTTGNVYGIYDLSGGAYELVAAYNTEGNSEELYNGKSLESEENEEYVTKYTGENINVNYIIGDATYETKNWNGDNSSFLKAANPFFVRSGYFNHKSVAGIFFTFIGNGTDPDASSSSRICLVIH